MLFGQLVMRVGSTAETSSPRWSGSSQRYAFIVDVVDRRQIRFHTNDGFHAVLLGPIPEIIGAKQIADLRWQIS